MNIIDSVERRKKKHLYHQQLNTNELIININNKSFQCLYVNFIPFYISYL